MSELSTALDESLADLKDFQIATVERVFAGLFEKKLQAVLVADEVGLGKTIVAKGVIVQALRKHVKTNPDKPFRVTYICSNQVLATENIRKLSIHGLTHESRVRRITELTQREYLPPTAGKPLIINSLTPQTSFVTSRSTGAQKERRLLFALLVKLPFFRTLKRWRGLARVLQGPVQDRKTWVSSCKLVREDPTRPGLAFRYRKACLATQLTALEYPRIFALFPGKRETSLWHALCAYTEEKQIGAGQAYRGGALDIIKLLRKTLTEVCVEYADADLYILDEFQRFRSLILDPENAKNDSAVLEAAIIAKKIFARKSARVLLLSATPFKAYTGIEDEAQGEHHYGEFRDVLHFLMAGDRNRVKGYEQHRAELYEQLRSSGEEGSLDPTHRVAIEQILRPIISRTERISITEDHNAMIHDSWRDKAVPFQGGDVVNFLAADRVVQALNQEFEASRHTVPKPLEYCKSAPYPLSFLDQYQIRNILKRYRTRPAVRDALRANPEAWIEKRGVADYSLRLDSSTCGNARFRQLADKVFARNAEKLLWAPPSLPYYPLQGVYEHAEGFTKTLVFSSWIMVPRMISTLVSYEAERRTLGRPEVYDRGTNKEQRVYFTPDNRRRAPGQQLRFGSHEAAKGKRGSKSTMSIFSLLYPSPTLAGLLDPLSALNTGRKLKELKKQLKSDLRSLFKLYQLKQFEDRSRRSDRWYWFAPFLLDKLGGLEDTTSNWIGRATSSATDDDAKNRSADFVLLERMLENSVPLNLGPMPADLFDVLADVALGSPSICAYRSLTRIYKGTDTLQAMVGATRIGDAFVRMLNKPEAIAAIRLSVPGAAYWHAVLKYGGDSCLQAVTDEYLHLLAGTHRGPDAAVEAFVESASLTTASVNVDDLDGFLEGQPFKMRTHFAVELGNQKLETEEGENRVLNVRQNFNSPFRPFVLATTSIGQEGLDFHYYCRRVVHWNLPRNPIDLEQREGRVNRFKGLVVRQRVASGYGKTLPRIKPAEDVWASLFKHAAAAEKATGVISDLVPFWVVSRGNHHIERFIPVYPYSQDLERVHEILRTVAVYRLAFGQPRQEELVELLRNIPPERLKEVRETLLIDLCPLNEKLALNSDDHRVTF